MSNLALTNSSELFSTRFRHAILELHTGTEFFPKLRIWNANDRDIVDYIECVQELFDFSWIEVFTATDDHLFDTPGDFDISVVVHDPDITRMEPSLLINCFFGRVGIVVVASHDIVPAEANLAGGAAIDGLTGAWINDLLLLPGHHTPHCRNAPFDRVIGASHVCDR